MQISVECQCSRRFRVPESAAGKQIKCPGCGLGLEIPFIATPVSQPDAIPLQKQLRPAPTPPQFETINLADENLDSFLETPQSTWTLNDSARASNPGDLRVNLLVWFTHYPKWPLVFGLSLLFSVMLATVVHSAFWIGVLILAALNFFYWQRVRDHFRHGCINPSIVVCLDPMLIAVATDLTKGVGEFPVIKIFKKRLSVIGGCQPVLGSRLATVSLYYATPDDSIPHWASFDPRPVECATTDKAEIDRMLLSISESDWQELGRWLGQVPRPFECGLYTIHADF